MTNQFCRRSDYPADYVSTFPDDHDAIIMRGGAVIVDPLGQVLAGPLWDQEGILTAEIDLRAVTRALYDFDPVGHYSRRTCSLSRSTRGRGRRSNSYSKRSPPAVPRLPRRRRRIF